MMNTVDNPHLHKTAVTSSVFCQDNLELVKSQPDESVNMIYCDILYGTGRNFGEYQDLKPIRSEIESHYLPRLIEMKRVLKQNGSIYLQMDTTINHWMRILMDKVFGYDNFKNEIIWDKGFRGTEKSKCFQNSHDVVLYYAMGNFKWNDVYCEYADKKMSRYNKTDESGLKYASIKRKRTDGSIYYGKCYPKTKGKKADDVIRDLKTFASTSKERNGYPTQKPKELIKRFVLASSNENDVVADYYLGSGTTAEVCKELNRNFIGCDINPKAIEITKNRLYGTGTR
jgi:DNA modification methylase